MNSRFFAALLVGACTILSCARSEPPGATNVASAPNTPPARLSASPASSPAPRPSEMASAPPSLSVAPSAEAPAASASAPPIDWSNKAKPDLQSPLLAPHASALLNAIIKDDPEIARDFFFPREPFKPLKDVADADKYWRQLYGTYKRDIHELHTKRRDWTGATFESIELGSPPTWVKPGDEYNKIGYFRTFRAKLRYKIEDKRHSIELHTIISWNGEWFITHLLPFKR